MRQAESSDVVYECLASFFPEWDGIIDVETGEPLANPSEDPSVFGRIDRFEQLPWFAQQIQVRPAPNGNRSRQGQKLH